MKYAKHIILAFLLVFSSSQLFSEVTVKVRDITTIDGLRMNQVLGYGVVVGLQGTGDTRSKLSQSSLKNVLKLFGLEGKALDSKNIAAVIITAKLPPFVRVGDRIDVTVSSIGDAKSLAGGILIQSPLKGADNKTYVVAQGSLYVPRGTAQNKKVNTVALIKRGGLIEATITPKIINRNSISLILHDFDYSVALEIKNKIKKKYPNIKTALDNSGKISIAIPPKVELSKFISTIQQLEVKAPTPARVVIHERDGTIVAGGDVKLSPALVSRQGITIEIEDSNQKKNVSYLKESSSVKDLVDALNAVNASAVDIISILKALKDAGALHGELIIK